MLNISERLAEIDARIDEACRRSGRETSSVLMVAVTKGVPPGGIAEAIDAGMSVFGESRIQEAREKIERAPGAVQWHFIGHLQTNKCRDAARLFEFVHSVDSLKLLIALDVECRKQGVEMPVCLEVNVSGEATKFGMSPQDVSGVLEAAGTMLNVSVKGLMTIPPFTENPSEARRYFTELRELRDKVSAATGCELQELSMGMTRDFDVAIEEGATLIRVGTALFGEARK